MYMCACVLNAAHTGNWCESVDELEKQVFFVCIRCCMVGPLRSRLFSALLTFTPRSGLGY
jgi:hypothetical protein